MSDVNRISGSVEDFVIGMADSLASAQRRLAEQIVWLPNGQTVIYQVPRLEFELKVGFDFQAVESQAGGGGLRLRALPASAMQRSGAEMSSTIRGSFVAIPLTGVSTPPRLAVSDQRVDARRVRVIAQVSREPTQPLPGATVRFGIDHELSRQLNGGASLDDNTLLARAEVITGPDGVADSHLFIGAEEPEERRVAVRVWVAGVDDVLICRAVL